jgi:hypothetical protein
MLTGYLRQVGQAGQKDDNVVAQRLPDGVDGHRRKFKLYYVDDYYIPRTEPGWNQAVSLALRVREIGATAPYYIRHARGSSLCLANGKLKATLNAGMTGKADRHVAGHTACFVALKPAL